MGVAEPGGRDGGDWVADVHEAEVESVGWCLEHEVADVFWVADSWGAEGYLVVLLVTARTSQEFRYMESLPG